MAMKNLSKNFLLVILAFFVVSFLFSRVNGESAKTKTANLGEIVTAITNGTVKQVEVDGNKLNVTYANDEKRVAYKESTDSFTAMLKDYGVAPEKIAALDIQVKQPSSATVWMGTLIPIVLPLALFIGFFWFMMRQAQGMNNRAMSFGQTAQREQPDQKQRTGVTFKDVAGVKEAKQELVEVVEFLKFPKKFTALGAKIPKGVLLVGSPGTGKTLLAKAVAGEADVPFFHISGSEFVEMFVGVGASRVRDLFRRAKKAAPSIIFVDEIDAVARQRGSG